MKTVKGHTFRERGVGKTVGSRTSRDVPFGSLQTGSLVGQERGTTVWRSWLNVQSGPSKPSGELAVWRNMVPEKGHYRSHMGLSKVGYMVTFNHCTWISCTLTALGFRIILNYRSMYIHILERI